MHSTYSRSIIPAFVFAAIAISCGGGGSSVSPYQSSEIAFELGLDGPGDPDNYFPMSLGNRWIYEGTETSTAGVAEYQGIHHISGTTVINGLQAKVYSEYNTLDFDPSNTYLYEDLNGIANLGVDSFDPFEKVLENFWEVVYPLTAGTDYVHFDRKGIRLSQDIDMDGKTDTADIYSVVTVVGLETVMANGQSYSALHLNRVTEIVIHVSSSSTPYPATIVSDIYTVSNVGTVLQETTIHFPDNTSETTHEELVAYNVEGATSGITSIATQVMAKQGTLAGSKEYFQFNVTAGNTYVVSLAGITGEADLVPLMPSSCSQGWIKRGTNKPEDCRFTASSNNVLFAVNTNVDSDYVLSISPYQTVTLPADESATIAVDTPTLGQVGTRSSSYYSATGLPLGNHTISISGLSADADLRVYLDNTYSFELDCTLRAAGDVSTEPGDCIVSNVTEVYFKVDAGEINMNGASYNILVH